MPFPFTLPTTSALALTSFFSSPSHPSLLLTATTHRSVLRDALKKQKRLPPAGQQTALAGVRDALNAYLPFALVISSALKGQVQAEHVVVIQEQPFRAEWRPTLTSSIPGREPPRVKVDSYDAEIVFVLESLAYIYTLIARYEALSVYKTGSLSLDQRSAAVAGQMKLLLTAQSIHSYALSVAASADTTRQLVDVSPSTASALASLALAEATLVVVQKDDPYAAAVAEDRREDSKDWMVAAPTIPKVRAHLFARLCLAAADHAAKASGLLAQSGKSSVDEALVRYVDDLRRTARGKAARFLAVDAELAGKTGEAIAWLRGATTELGFTASDDSGKRKGLKGLKQSWSERREDKKMDKGGERWGLDAGRFEEARVVEWLEGKWSKQNDTINIQSIPAYESLIARMPSGREYHSPTTYQPPTLEPDVLTRMRAPPDPSERMFTGNEDDSEDDMQPSSPPGAFPGAQTTYY